MAQRFEAERPYSDLKRFVNAAPYGVVKTTAVEGIHEFIRFRYEMTKYAVFLAFAESHMKLLGSTALSTGTCRNHKILIVSSPDKKYSI